MKKSVLSLIAGFFLVSAVHAEPLRSWRVSGFISQSFIYTSDNAFFGHSDDALNSDFRELALIASGKLTPQLDVSAQFLSRKAGSADDGFPRMDYGFFNWRFYETIESTHGFMLGRIKVPFGFFNDTRESPFSRTSIFLPQSVYIDRIRNSEMSADELLYFYENRQDEWTFAVKAGYGRSISDAKELTDTFDIEVYSDDFKFSDEAKWNVQLLADYDAGRLRFGFSRYTVPESFSATLYFPNLPPYPVSGKAMSYWNVYSFEYNQNAFSFTTEWFQTVINYAGLTFDPSNPVYRNYPSGGYVQLLWRVDEKWDVFWRNDRDVFDNKDNSGRIYSRYFGAPAFSRFAYDKTAGVSYRPALDWLIRFELHRVNGTMWMTKRDLPDGYQVKRHWDMAALSIAWRF